MSDLMKTALVVTTMTLKEITDLLCVEHNKAMKTVAKMATAPEFGAVSKIATVYNDKGQTIQTYKLNKRQALAVSAKLNVSLLMVIVDAFEAKYKPLTRVEAAQENLRLTIEVEALELENKEQKVQLDKSLEFSTIKRQEGLYGESYNWRVLTKSSVKLNVERKDVFDQNYGTVKSYHKDAWLDAYDVVI